MLDKFSFEKKMYLAKQLENAELSIFQSQYDREIIEPLMETCVQKM